MRRDGLGREVVLSLIHDDGHVGMLANHGTLEPMIIQLHTLYAWMGIEGWAVQCLPVEEAVYAHMQGQGCARCAVVFDCGCSWLRVAARQCGHGSAGRLHALAHVVGYCANDNPMHLGPPLPTVVRVFEAGSRMGHLALVGAATAQCGYEPAGWLGLADERQQATARRLPTCNACLRAVADTSGTPEGGGNHDSE